MVLGYLHIIEFGKWGSSLYLIRWENKKKNFSSKKVVEMFAGMPNSPYLCNRIKRNASYNNKTKS